MLKEETYWISKYFRGVPMANYFFLSKQYATCINNCASGGTITINR